MELEPTALSILTDAWERSAPVYREKSLALWATKGESIWELAQLDLFDATASNGRWPEYGMTVGAEAFEMPEFQRKYGERNWPTPTASMYFTGRGSNHDTVKAFRERGVAVKDMNLAWVEVLMGYPAGSTSLTVRGIHHFEQNKE